VKLLAIDTSSLACTVALRIGDELIERHEEQEREHTRLLIPMIRDVLDQAGVTPNDLDAIVLGNGPGSFIGMRIAASVCQGLAHGAGLKIIPVSSLAAVAAEVMDSTDAETVIVTQDAHMQQVYMGLYLRSAENSPQPVCDERLQGQEMIDELRRGEKSSTVAAGQGWQRYPKLLAANESLLGAQSDVLYPHARYLLALADLSAAIPAEDIQPAYLRQKVAEVPGTRELAKRN
jgi:tRNA threonylcarbamoyladenosine biosynthesis protein TsaB